MRRTTLLLFLAAAIPACEDATGPGQDPPADLDIVVPLLTEVSPADTLSIRGDRPAAGEEEDYGAASILWTRIESGFRPDYAWSQAAMEFWANHASIDLTMTLRYGNTTIGTRDALALFGQWIPLRERLDVPAALGITGDCGHLIDASARFSAWQQIEPNGYTWGNDVATRPSVAQQPACTPPDPTPVKVTKEVKGGSEGEEDSDWYICYYTYYYDSVTGKLLYTDFHGCEPL